MNRKFEYDVTITFAKANVVNSIGVQNIPYYLGKGNTDKIIFHKKKIKLCLFRFKKYSKEDILTKPNNTVNSQIIKSLILYYLNASNFPILKSIKCVIKNSQSEEELLSLNSQDLPNILSNQKEREEGMYINPNQYMWEESKLGNVIRIASSHWLHALNADNSLIKFNHLWIAFNALFGYYGNSKRECENLRYFKSQLLQHDELFSKSINVIKDFDAQRLRNSFRWLLMCKHDLRCAESTFCSRVDFTDQRILHMFNSVTCSSQILGKIENQDNYTALRLKLDNISTITNDIEVVALICIRYAYFIRNLHQHGNVLDSLFKLELTQEDSELAIINKLLLTLILEIIQGCDKLKVNADEN